MIICFPGVGLRTDVPYWVTKEQFYNYFDQDDFNCREEKTTTAVYLEKWFYMDEDGKKYFILPTVQFVNGKTQFINGRHRTSVIINYMDEIPISFAMSLDDREYCLNRYSSRKMEMDEVLELPDLPIVKKITENAV